MENEHSGIFSQARIRLSLWYCLILIIILFFFSISLFTTENSTLTRVVLLRDFGNQIPRTLTPLERADIRLQIRELRRTLIFNLLTINGLILLVGGGMSYFLAGKTLEPIRLSLKKQKEFLADASHELRTPLAAIQTSCEVALRSKSKSGNDLKKVIRQTYEESVRMGKLVGNLLTISRLDSFTDNVNLIPVSLTAVVTEAVEHLKPMAGDKKIKLNTSIAEKVSVLGDRDRLKELIMILLDNAVKYTPSGGTVTVSLYDHPAPAVTVTDTGMGIAPDDRRRIFERFYRGDKSRSTAGSGLGLPIARSIAKMHRAKISFTSGIGVGSIFSVEFPNI